MHALGGVGGMCDVMFSLVFCWYTGSVVLCYVGSFFCFVSKWELQRSGYMILDNTCVHTHKHMYIV